MSDIRAFGFHVRDGCGVVRAFRFPILAWAGDWAHGAFWVGSGRARILLKAPWCAPLFSERYGYVRYLRLFGGWRIRICRAAQS